MSGTNMNAKSISIFDIPLLVNLICCSLSAYQIADCRKVCKAWNVAFAPSEWRHVWLYKHLLCSPYDELTAEEIKLLRENSQWIQSTGMSLFETVLNDSLCTNLHSLVVYCDRAAPVNATVDESSLALLWRNRGLRDLLFDFYDSHVRRHVLPNLPRLTVLQELGIHIESKWTSDLALLLDVLQCLPPSLRELNLHTYSRWEWSNFSNILISTPRTWEPSALRRFSFRVNDSSYGPHILIPFLRSCHQLEELALPAMPSDYAEELMRSLASSCPRLGRLELNTQRRGMTESGTECLHFSHMHQAFNHLSIEIHTDIKNVVVQIVLAYSAARLRTLHLKKAARSVDVALILRTCPELRVFHVEALHVPGGRPTPSTTLQDLVEAAPWVCTRLEQLDLAITDVRDPTLVTDAAGKRKQLEHLVLRLHQQFQDLEDFSPYRAYTFWKQNFTYLPPESVLRDRRWQMTEDDLRKLVPDSKGYSNNWWSR